MFTQIRMAGMDIDCCGRQRMPRWKKESMERITGEGVQAHFVRHAPLRTMVIMRVKASSMTCWWLGREKA